MLERRASLADVLYSEGRVADQLSRFSQPLRPPSPTPLFPPSPTRTQYGVGDATSPASDRPTPEDDWETVGRKNKSALTREVGAEAGGDSVVTRIFQGSLCSTVKASTMPKASATVQPFLVLQLDIASPTVKDLPGALAEMARAEEVHGYRAEGSKVRDFSLLLTSWRTMRCRKHTVGPSFGGPHVSLVLRLYRIIFSMLAMPLPPCASMLAVPLPPRVSTLAAPLFRHACNQYYFLLIINVLPSRPDFDRSLPTPLLAARDGCDQDYQAAETPPRARAAPHALHLHDGRPRQDPAADPVPERAQLQGRVGLR